MLTVRDEEIEHVDRVLRAADLESLPDRDDLPDCWLLAYILCPGDEFAALLDWMDELEIGGRGRVQIYNHPDADLPGFLETWFDRGLPPPVNYEVSTFRQFHKVFGWEFNDRVYMDATGWTPP